MARAGHNLERFWSSQLCKGLLVELDDAKVGAADNQKGWRLNAAQSIPGEIGASATRHYRTDAARKLGCRNQRSRRSGTGAKQPEWKCYQ